eukprot:gnl/TRDRNA2_/TRDRNA2_175256_c0_seq11.p1 gnl/TRDRNA2_/TRDRNA2_175256_c0~~gnl/TRDRNA2_/TRDRNA2_175256_c0_seq11.p1  ORF type:complete len:333 (-),score=8.48 gnl/TRDRNA2_/TRDRNA2_175256_c0_seq11:237-1235(-)
MTLRSNPCRLFWPLQLLQLLAYSLSLAVRLSKPSDNDAHPRWPISSYVGRSTTEAVQSLNERFRTGQPSNNINRVGVILHAFDESSNHPPFTERKAPWHFREHFTFLSACIINARVPYMYLGWDGVRALFKESAALNGDPQHGAAGFIISPKAFVNSLLCSYPIDSSSIRVTCERHDKMCVPGCIGTLRIPDKGVSRPRTWCRKDNTSSWSSHDACPYPKGKLERMMKAHEARVATVPSQKASACKRNCCLYPSCKLYNEVILSTPRFLQAMPHALEAFYFTSGQAARSDARARQGEQSARAAQKFFQVKFGHDIPVVKIENFALPEPFQIV